MNETLNSEEASSLLKCSKSFACELARTGEIPAVHLGGQWLFIRSQILEYLLERARDEQALRRERGASIPSLIATNETPRSRGRPRKKEALWSVS